MGHPRLGFSGGEPVSSGAGADGRALSCGRAARRAEWRGGSPGPRIEARQRPFGELFLASDIEAASVENARRIVEANRERLGRIEVRLQPQAHRCFEHVIQPGEVLDFTLCNPPFHADRASAAAGSARKSQAVGRGAGAPLNFAGTAAELICAGGEHGFLHRMAKESVDFGNRVLWFTSLVSRQAHVSGLERSLQKLGARRVVVLPMKTGNKVTRLVAWTFLSARQQEDWRRFRWSGRD